MNIGTSNNTPSFAARSVEKWWEQLGSKLYPSARAIFVTADGGGSNSPKSRVWKSALQDVSDRFGLDIYVSHFPPGTSKWNKIEHRLFSFITLNWRGRLLATYETVVSLIAATSTSKGLSVVAELDRTNYPLGRRLDAEHMELLRLELEAFHGDWNYVLRPRTALQLKQAAAPSSRRKPVSHAERKKRWTKLIFEQQASGLSRRAFCKEHGINRGAFHEAFHRIVGNKIPPPK